MKKTALLLLFCATLSACAENPVEIRTERVTIPELLLTCPAEPTPPPETMTQRDVALYIIDLRGYGRTCASQLAAIRELQGALTKKPD